MKTKLYLLLGLFLLTGCTFQHGSSRDIVQGWDKGIIWYHAYLKNDHTTAYCFDNPDFIKIMDISQKTQKEIILTYETYILRGALCTTSDKFDNVIITNITLAD